jgi:acetyl esterase/lipase
MFKCSRTLTALNFETLNPLTPVTMKTFLFFLLALLLNEAGAQDQRKLLVDSLVSKVIVKKDIQYNQSGRPLLLDIYYPPNYNQEKLPCIVWIHGGGLTSPKLTKDYDIIRWGTAASALNGFIAVSIDYRLVTEIPLPGAIEDCSTAIRFLKANADKYHINPDKMGVVGESSGGYLSAFMTYSGDTKTFTTNDWKKFSNKLACGVIWYGYTKHPNTKFDVLYYISANDPPSLLIHGEADKTVPLEESYKIKKVCEDKKLDVSLSVIKNADHGFFDVNGKFPDYKQHMDEAVQLTIAFFKKHLL